MLLPRLEISKRDTEQDYSVPRQPIYKVSLEKNEIVSIRSFYNSAKLIHLSGNDKFSRLSMHSVVFLEIGCKESCVL